MILLLVIFIIKTALALMKQASDELLEKSLPEDIERKIKEIAENMEEDANPVMLIAKFKE